MSRSAKYLYALVFVMFIALFAVRYSLIETIVNNVECTVEDKELYEQTLLTNSGVIGSKKYLVTLKFNNIVSDYEATPEEYESLNVGDSVLMNIVLNHKDEFKRFDSIGGISYAE